MNGLECGCKSEGLRQVLWCESHNGWTYAREVDARREKAEAKVKELEERIEECEQWPSPNMNYPRK